MTTAAQQITTVKRRGRFLVQAIGRTPRGMKYIIQEVELTAKSTADPEFKTEQAAAISKLLGSAA